MRYDPNSFVMASRAVPSTVTRALPRYLPVAAFRTRPSIVPLPAVWAELTAAIIVRAKQASQARALQVRSFAGFIGGWVKKKNANTFVEVSREPWPRSQNGTQIQRRPPQGWVKCLRRFLVGHFGTSMPRR